MTTIDYVLIGIVVISAIIGLFRGLMREALSLVTWVAALWCAWHFGPGLEPHLGGLLDSSAVRPWAARVIIFFGVLLLGMFAGWLVTQFVRVSLFQSVDRLFGVVFGLLRAFVVIGALAILGQALELDRETWWKKAKLTPYAENAGSGLRSIVGDDPVARAQELLLSTGGRE
ncbi:MAG TPA: CvpA family protein [Steroidobacteraceae bacterium]|nr:CvpA family protein [Steroidobacteraceae bacterium]